MTPSTPPSLTPSGQKRCHRLKLSLRDGFDKTSPPITMETGCSQTWMEPSHSIQPSAQRLMSIVQFIQHPVLSRTSTLTASIYSAYDDGRTHLLLCVHGLLPIDYRQASYHIPIAIWITRQYPREPPLSFVVPTSDMLVKPSQHINVSGLCRIEYVLNWEKKHEVRRCHIAVALI